MSDGGFCHYCKRSSCECLPDDYESPVEKFDRLRKEVPLLKERIKQLEDQIRELNEESKWSEDIPSDCDFVWLKAKGDDRKTIGYIDPDKEGLICFSLDNLYIVPFEDLSGVGLEFRKVK